MLLKQEFLHGKNYRINKSKNFTHPFTKMGETHPDKTELHWNTYSVLETINEAAFYSTNYSHMTSFINITKFSPEIDILKS